MALINQHTPGNFLGQYIIAKEATALEISQNNDKIKTRKGCKDIWNAYMADGVIYSHHDIPFCPTTATKLPHSIITWENAGTFTEKSVFVYATALQDMGYTVRVKNSTRSKSGAQIITVSNTSKDRNISQIQVSPGGGRHGDSPYVKISTTDNGKFKIVDGIANNYKSNAKETAEIIFRRKNND